MTPADPLGRLPTPLILASLALLTVRIIVAANTGLTDDEAYNRVWGLAPALSYLDHPPMTGWLIAAGRWLLGDNPLGVRLAAVLAPLLGTLLAWRAVGLLFGPKVALRAGWYTLALPLLAAGGVLMTPDVPSVVTWGLTGWAAAELYRSRRANWWLGIGLFAGLGLISKYSNLFAGAGLVLWLVASPGARHWWRTWQLWAGGALAALLTLPVDVWNWQHHGASFTKQFGRVGAGEGLTLRFLGELVGGMVGLLSPAIAVLAAWGVWHVFRRALKDRNSPEFLLFCSIVPFASYLLVHSLHDRVQANWPAPLYPAFAVLAALVLEIPALQIRPALRLARWALPLGFGISAAFYLHTMHPFVQLPGTRDPSSQMRGWSDFATLIEAKRAASGAAWIATSSYATTGQLMFALHAHAPVVQIDERLRYIHLPPVPEAVLRAPALYVDLARYGALARLQAHFGTVTNLGHVERRYAGVIIETYETFLLADPVLPVLPPVE